MTEIRTAGQDRVRAAFNPSEKTEVDEVKAECAALIDRCLQDTSDPRAAAIAATHFETGCMYLVKSITKS